MTNKFLAGQTVSFDADGSASDGVIAITESGEAAVSGKDFLIPLAEAKNIRLTGKKICEDIDKDIDALASQIDWKAVSASGQQDKIIDSFADSILNSNSDAMNNKDAVTKAAKDRANAEIIKTKSDNGTSTVSNELDKYYKTGNQSSGSDSSGKMAERQESLRKSFIDAKRKLSEDAVYAPETDSELSQIADTFIPQENSDGKIGELAVDAAAPKASETVSNNYVYPQKNMGLSPESREEAVAGAKEMIDGDMDIDSIARDLCTEYEISEDEAFAIISEASEADESAQDESGYEDEELNDIAGLDTSDADRTDSDIEDIVDNYESTANDYSNDAMYEHVCASLGITNGKDILRECNGNAPAAVLKISECIRQDRLREATVTSLAKAIETTVGDDNLLSGTRAPKLSQNAASRIKNWCTKLGSQLVDDTAGMKVTLSDARTFFGRVIDSIASKFRGMQQQQSVKAYFSNSQNADFFSDLFGTHTFMSFSRPAYAPSFGARQGYRESEPAGNKPDGMPESCATAGSQPENIRS